MESKLSQQEVGTNQYRYKMLAFLLLRNLFLFMLDKEGNENCVHYSVYVQLSEQWVYGDAYRSTGDSLEDLSSKHTDDNSGMVHHCSFQCSVQTAMTPWSLLPSPWCLYDLVYGCMPGSSLMCLGSFMGCLSLTSFLYVFCESTEPFSPPNREFFNNEDTAIQQMCSMALPHWGTHS